MQKILCALICLGFWFGPQALAQYATKPAVIASVTHTVNNDQRRLPLAITVANGTTYTVKSPANSGVGLPGYYLLFAIDINGVPSVARYIQVK